LVWVLIFGIIGARLYHVFSSPAEGLGFSYYREHPLEAINPFSAAGFGFRGLGIFGAVVGGVFGIWLYTRVLTKPRLNLLRWLDIAAPGVLLAQAIGRFGNFINQELYGPPTDLPWGFKINPNYPYQPPPPGIDVATTRFHPTFFYESGWNLIMFFLLLFLARRLAPKLKDGDVFLGYLIAYPLGRFWVEMFRPDAWRIGAMATAQWISLGLIVFSVVMLFIRHRPGVRATPAVLLSEPPPENEEPKDQGLGGVAP
jgi:phosphatidylglycerol:prolipoprotein diacylglycerol transferase